MTDYTSANATLMALRDAGYDNYCIRLSASGGYAIEKQSVRGVSVSEEQIEKLINAPK